MSYRIGVDARLLSEQITGIGRYSSEMLKRLVQLDHEWFFYSHRPIIVGDWDLPNVHIRTANLSGRVARMLWAQTVMPMAANRDKLDLFWAPTHRLPRYISKDIARVVTVHDLVWKHSGETMRPLSRWLDAKLMPEAVKLADKVISVSENTAIDIRNEMDGADDKITTIHLGVSDLTPAGPKDALAGLGLSGDYFLFVGTLEPRKNLARLIEAFSRLPEETRNQVTLAIAGGRGWGGVDVETLAAQFGVGGQVRNLGYVSETDLATLYENALFLAMPSLYEGFGLPLIEAMGRDTPVLTSNCASMPEVAGDAGLLVDPHDVGSIADGLQTLLQNSEVRARLAAAASDNVKRFNWDHAAQRTMAVFDEAYARRKALK